jgi:hypothetical protein
MASYFRLMLQAAAVTGVAAILCTAAPAIAAEGPADVVESTTAPVSTPEAAIAPVSAAEAATAPEAANAMAKAVPAVIKRRHASRRTPRIAVSSYDHGSASIYRNDLGCYGFWCERQFVLILGIGF